jgi:hypothetical protein
MNILCLNGFSTLAYGEVSERQYGDERSMFHNDLLDNEDGNSTSAGPRPALVIGGRRRRDERDHADRQIKPKVDEAIHFDGINSVIIIIHGLFAWIEDVDGSMRSFNRDGASGNVADKYFRAKEQACSNDPTNLQGVRAHVLSKEPITVKHDLQAS